MNVYIVEQLPHFLSSCNHSITFSLMMTSSTCPQLINNNYRSGRFSIFCNTNDVHRKFLIPKTSQKIIIYKNLRSKKPTQFRIHYFASKMARLRIFTKQNCKQISKFYSREILGYYHLIFTHTKLWHDVRRMAFSKS